MREEVNNLLQLRRTPEEEKAIMFYAARSDCYPSFEGLIEELIGKHNLVISYITSDSVDLILQRVNSGLRSFYLNRLFPLLAAFTNCKVFVMTLTDLNRFHIKRSINPVHYVYVFHSLVSTHMVYLQGAFDHYDSILCCGPHQVREIRKREELRGLPPKELIEAGYSRLERIYEAYQKYLLIATSGTVLIAPSWGPNNILEVCGKHLVKLLLSNGYKVIVRLHPELLRRTPNLVFQYASKFGNNSNFTLEMSVATDDSLLLADVLISDYSGVALEYAFGTERPVIFINTPPKVRNPKYQELKLAPIEVSLRNEIGIVVPLTDIESTPNSIRQFQNERGPWKTKLSKLRSEYVFNFGQASKTGASYIRSLV